MRVFGYSKREVGKIRMLYFDIYDNNLIITIEYPKEHPNFNRIYKNPKFYYGKNIVVDNYKGNTVIKLKKR
jgi:hypothetical protein